MFVDQLPVHCRAIVEDSIQTIRSINATHLYVGCSGGADSTLLLFLACQAIGASKVSALHVNHQLSAQAEAFEQQVIELAQQLGCGLEVSQVQVENTGQGIEAAARQQRYEAFKKNVPADAVLLLGHHADDQIETFFLRMLRGSGVHGLQGMASSMTRDHYQLHRPMLGLTHETIVELCQQLQLNWVEDASNLDTRFDRNFLRQSVLPLIESRWPGYRDKVLQTIFSLAQSTSSESSLANFDVELELQHRLSHDRGLKLVQLGDYTQTQLLTLLHRWLTSIEVPVPSTARLQAIVDHVIQAKSDAQPCVEISGGEIRRHGPALYWVQPAQALGPAPEVLINEIQLWQGVGQINLTTETDDQPKLKVDLPNLQWRLRSGGEVMRPFGRSKRRDLKRLFQEYRQKPWLRDRTPLLFSGDELVAVGDLLISAEHVADENEPGLQVRWQNSD